MKKSICPIISLLLCAVMLLGLCACAADSMPVFDIFRAPEFSVSGSAPYDMPVLSGISWAEDATAEITAALQPLADRLHEANSLHDVARLDYSFEPSGEDYRLEVYICGTMGGAVRVGEFTLSKKGTVTPYMAYPDYIGDGDYLNGLLRLQRYGMTIDAPSSSDAPTQNELMRFCADYYEAVCGHETDTSALYWQHEDTDFMEAVALGLATNDYELFSLGYYEEIPASVLSQYLSITAKRLLVDYYGQSSAVVSLSDLTDTVEAFMHFYDSETFIDWSSVISACKNADLSAVETPEEINRLDAAVVFGAMYEEVLGKGSLKEPDYEEFADGPSDISKKVAYSLLMDHFPAYGLFSEDYVIHGDRLADIVNTFVWNLFWHYTDTVDGYFSEANQTLSVSYRDIIAALGWLDSIFDDIPLPESNAVVVDNSRSYEWYFRQFNTGDYSEVNCMPSISAMAIKWYYPDSAVTVEELRNLYIEENDSGWYMSQVLSALEAYSVPYTYHYLHEDKITDSLDEGKIILAQMSESDVRYSGHCFVIYGYRKLGDSVQYFVHDPGVYDGLDDFGKEPGRAMVIDSRYAEYIIYRFTDAFVAIG